MTISLSIIYVKNPDAAQVGSMCLGYSSAYHKVLSDTAPDSWISRVPVRLFSLIFFLTMHILELTFYVVICHHLYQNDLSLKTYITANNWKRRMKKNAISLAGYIIDFGLEIASRILLVAGHGLFSKSALAVIGVSPFGLIALVAFLRSQEIRRELLIFWTGTLKKCRTFFNCLFCFGHNGKSLD